MLMTCDHNEVKRSGQVYEDGYLVEYDEECVRCSKKWKYAYGQWEDLEDEND